MRERAERLERELLGRIQPLKGLEVAVRGGGHNVAGRAVVAELSAR